MSERDTTGAFLQEYRRLEDAIRARYPRELEDGDSPLFVLKNQRDFKSESSTIEYCRELRNLLTHQPKSHGKAGVRVTEGAVDMVKGLEHRVAHPKRVGDIMIRKDKIFTCTMDDNVLHAIKEMQDHTYTHIPILEGGVVTGVFSENTVLCCLAEEGIIGVDKNTTFRSFSEFLPVDKHVAESFRFVPRAMTKTALEDMFAKAVNNGDRIGMIFVTQNGRPEEKLLGIVTAWDMARG